MKHIFIFVIMSLIALPFAISGDSDTFVEITENFKRFAGYFVNDNPVSENIDQTSIISCAEVKKRAEMYGNFVKNVQTDDLSYGAMYKKMDFYESVYTYNCNK